MKNRSLALITVLAVIAVLAGAGMSEAQVTDLMRIPTIDTVCHGCYYFDFGTDGNINDLENSYTYINTEFGYSDRFEAGVDIDLSDTSKSLLNAKYVALTNKNRSAGMAVGIYDITAERVATPYIVAGYTLSKYRVHAGLMSQDQQTRMFTGIEGPLSDKFLIKADHITGAGNVTAVGLGYYLNDHTALTVGRISPNSGGQGLTGLELELVMTKKQGIVASVAVPDGGGDAFFSIILTHTYSYLNAKPAAGDAVAGK